MSLMSFMESMSAGGIPLVSAFFIGLMTALSPCPLTTNITAIAYIAKDLKKTKRVLLTGLLYSLGRIITYSLLASLIVYFSLSVQEISSFFQRYGNMILGPILVFVGLFLVRIIKLDFINIGNNFLELKEKLGKKGFMGAFLMGALFALAFCPFSAVLFFGMLIPLALQQGDGLFIPSSFALATGLPVIIASIVLVKGITSLSKFMKNVQSLEEKTRKIAGIIILLIGIYHIITFIFAG